VVELDQRICCDLEEPLVKLGDPRPVGRARVWRVGVASGDESLHLVGTDGVAPNGHVEDRVRLVDVRPLPAGAVLVFQRNHVARGVGSGLAAGVLKQKQRQQPTGLGLVGHQPVQQSRQADRLRAEADPDQLITG
jgi:hypothetical protein